eukprot:scaffold26982_cov46-Attheya_sp.AAC.2
MLGAAPGGKSLAMGHCDRCTNEQTNGTDHHSNHRRSLSCSSLIRFGSPPPFEIGDWVEIVSKGGVWCACLESKTKSKAYPRTRRFVFLEIRHCHLAQLQDTVPKYDERRQWCCDPLYRPDEGVTDRPALPCRQW